MAVGEKTAQLSYLDITGCRAVTDVGLSAVARNCRLLQTVSLKHCFRLTDASLVQLVQGTGLHLRALIAKDVRGMSDQVLKAIAESCSQVRSLLLAPFRCSESHSSRTLTSRTAPASPTLA